MANDTVTSGPRCLFVQRQPKMGTDRGGSFVIMVENIPHTYLSVQCDILCNCCSLVPVTYQYLKTIAENIFPV